MFKMGKYIDFVVDYNSDPEILGRSIIRNLTCNRLKAKKPCIIFLTGDSGEGKSFSGLKIIDIVCEEFGLNTIDILDDAVVYTPLEYVRKLDNCLFYKKNERRDLKDLRVIMIDEAREVIRARLWYTFINQAISDCNAMSRTVKPIVLLVVSQFIKDVDSSVRYTITYYGKCARPLQGRTQFSLERVWKDDYDLDRPKLRKRPVKGYLRNNNAYSLFKPRFEVALPRKDIIEKYEKQNFESKSKILRKKIETTLMMLEKEIGHEFDKVKALVDYYINNPEQLQLIKDSKYKKFRLKKEFKDMHELTNIEIQEFQQRLLEKLAEKGLAAAEQEIKDI